MKPSRHMATADHLAAFSGLAGKSVRGWVWMVDGQPAAIAGLLYPGRGHPPVVISEIAPSVRAFPHFVVREARALMRSLSDVPLRAIAEPSEPTSGRFLRAIGFRRVGPTPEGDVYEWRQGGRA